MDDVRGQEYEWHEAFDTDRMGRFEVGPGPGTWLVLGTLAMGAGLVWWAWPRGRQQAVEVVPRVEIGRYLGTWYEIARYPNVREIACSGATAHYSLRTDGSLVVFNRCRKDGMVVSARGLATPHVSGDYAKLHMRFVGSLGAYAGDYWIIQIGPHYEYSVVSDRDRRELWIFSRTPRLPQDIYRGILSRLQEQGFDTRRLITTPQPERI